MRAAVIGLALGFALAAPAPAQNAAGFTPADLAGAQGEQDIVKALAKR